MKRRFVINLEKNRRGTYELHHMECPWVTMMTAARFLGEHLGVDDAMDRARELGISAIEKCADCLKGH